MFPRWPLWRGSTVFCDGFQGGLHFFYFVMVSRLDLTLSKIRWQGVVAYPPPPVPLWLIKDSSSSRNIVEGAWKRASSNKTCKGHRRKTDFGCILDILLVISMIIMIIVVIISVHIIITSTIAIHFGIFILIFLIHLHRVIIIIIVIFTFAIINNYSSRPNGLWVNRAID